MKYVWPDDPFMSQARLLTTENIFSRKIFGLEIHSNNSNERHNKYFSAQARKKSSSWNEMVKTVTW